MSTTLFDAHVQWVKRPADERFSTLNEILEYTSKRKHNATEEIRVLRNLKLHATHEGRLLLNGEIQQAIFSNWAFSQMCQILHAPAGYLRTLPSGTVAQCLEHGLQREHGESKMLLRRDDGDDGEPGVDNLENVVSAFTSTSYGRIWDSDVVGELVEAVKDTGWHPPASKTGTGGLYASDRDMFLFLVNDERPVEIGNAKLGRGFFLWNSETGSASFGLTTFLYNFICGNHIVWGAEEVQELRIVHRHRALSRFYQDAIPVLNRFVENRSLDTRIETAVTQAMNDRIGSTLEEVVSSERQLSFTKNELASAWDIGLAEGEDVTTRWGLTQGLTAYARTLPFADKRVNLERRAGALLN